jgi:hypothetical protein
MNIIDYIKQVHSNLQITLSRDVLQLSTRQTIKMSVVYLEAAMEELQDKGKQEAYPGQIHDLEERIKKRERQLANVTSVNTFSEAQLQTAFPLNCTDCGWTGISTDCNEGQAIADTGDYFDPTCPVYNSADLEELSIQPESEFTKQCQTINITDGQDDLGGTIPTIDAMDLANIVTDLRKAHDKDMHAFHIRITKLQNEESAIRREAAQLATKLNDKYYKQNEPQWELCDSTRGIISQIDNMLAGLMTISQLFASSTRHK